MEPSLARRAVLVSVLMLGALFFSALGFFLGTVHREPTPTQAQGLWTDGAGLLPEQRSIPSFASVAERMGPTVVYILVTGGAPVDGASPDGEPVIPPEEQQVSEGSGVIISKDGYILTNQHVVFGAQDVSVTLSDGTRLTARVVGSDGRNDLALLLVDAGRDLQAAPLGDSEGLRPGDWVMAMGNPLGFEHSVTVGVISGKGRTLPSSRFSDFIQTDAAIYPGNSGGPLFDLAGEVVGINTAVIPDTNLGFAVPIDSAKETLPQLLERGRVERGYLGVSIRSVSELAEPPRGVDAGAAVTEVVSGASAEQAGLMVGDVIVAVNGRPVRSAGELTQLVSALSPGSDVDLDIVREGRGLTLPAKVGSLPAELE